MSEFTKNAKDCVKNNARIKRSSRLFFFFLGLTCTFVLTFVANLNIFFFYLMLTKFLIWFGLYYFAIINACANTPQYLEIWNSSDMRIIILNERMKVACWWIVKLTIFSTALFILFRYITYTSKKYSTLISNSTLAAEEIFLILITILLSLIAIYTVAYWYVARYIKIRRWDEKAGLLKSDSKSLLTGYIPIFFLVLIIFIFDVLYIHMKLGIGLGSVEFLEPLLEPSGGYLLLLLEIVILLIVDIITYIDGKWQMRSRTTFVIAPLLEQIVPK